MAVEPRLQILRRSRRPLLCGVEQARQSALGHHVHRIAPLGAPVLINGTRYKRSSARTGTGALIVQTMLTVVTQNRRLPRRSALSGDRIVKSHECKAGPPEIWDRSNDAAPTLRLGPCPSRSGALRLKRHQPQFSYRSIQLNAGRREVSIRRLRRARAVLAACGVLADGNRVLVHLAPRTREDCRESIQDLRRRDLPDRLAPRGSKGPEQGRFGGYFAP